MVSGAQHGVRYRGRLLAVGAGYDPSKPDSFYDAMSADSILGRVAVWARTGFHPEIFGTLIGDPDNLQPQIDAITATLVAYDGRPLTKTNTLETFVGLAYHLGVAAIAASSYAPSEEFTEEELDRFIELRLVRSVAFDVVQIGAPQAAETLVGAIIEVLDYMYIAMHGDMAFLLGCWVNSFEMEPFASEKAEIEVFHPAEPPAFTLAPTLQGLADMLPVPPQFPQSNIGQQPTLALQATVYRRWEEVARGPAARAGLTRRRKEAEVAKWLAEKPTASPPSWPLPSFVPPPADDADKKRRSIGYNSNPLVQARLAWLQPLLAGANRTMPGKQKNTYSYMTYNDGGATAEKMVVLTGGAYPRGGRKPPSITHDTTYALDLDLADPDADVLQQTATRGRRALSDFQEALKESSKESFEGFEDPELADSFMQFFFTDGLTSLKKDAYLPAVALTQAIITTLPSRLIFGDPFVIAAAFGGLMDKLKIAGVTDFPDLFVRPEDYLILDPTVHFNHWHVDWVPAFERTRVPGWAFAPAGPKKAQKGAHKAPPQPWDIEGDFPAFESRERDFWRPVPIRYRDPRVSGLPEDIVNLNDRLGTGIDLNDETTFPAESPFPIGDVKDLPTLTGWLDQYFPHWRSP
jgi:hypothetical protein